MIDDIVCEKLVRVADGVQRLTAPNPGMMTGPGTNTYVVGSKQLAVIDPGPDIASHIQQIAAAGDVRWILVTHTHPDHSPGAMRLARLTGATVIGRPAPDGPHQDRSFRPDREPENGGGLDGPDFLLSYIHTPGHASNHFCFLLESNKMLFTGDHIMNGSTVVIDPPDGDMLAYLNSLRELRMRDLNSIAPGHGAVIDQPHAIIDWIVNHRITREHKVINALHEQPGSTSGELVPHVYDDVSEQLFGLAERSLLAHLIKLEHEHRAHSADGRWRAAAT